MTYKQSSARAWIIVILLLFYVFYRECRSGGRKSSNLLINRSFTILRSGEALTSFNKNNLVDFSVEKMFSEAFRDDYFLRVREKLLSFTWSSSHPRIYERSFKFVPQNLPIVQFVTTATQTNAHPQRAHPQSLSTQDHVTERNDRLWGREWIALCCLTWTTLITTYFRCPQSVVFLNL